jgi:hypothetical protein
MSELLDNIFVLIPLALLIFIRLFSDKAKAKARKQQLAKVEPADGQNRPVAQTGKSGAAQPAYAADPARPAMVARRPAAVKRPATVARQAATTGDTASGGPDSTTSRRPGRFTIQSLFKRLDDYLAGRPQPLDEQYEPLHFTDRSAAAGNAAALSTPRLGTFPPAQAVVHKLYQGASGIAAGNLGSTLASYDGSPTDQASTAAGNSFPVKAVTGAQAGVTRPSTVASQYSGPAYTFPARIEQLSPLRKALVLAEVLGKPKSLRDYPGG